MKHATDRGSRAMADTAMTVSAHCVWLQQDPIDPHGLLAIFFYGMLTEKRVPPVQRARATMAHYRLSCAQNMPLLLTSAT